MAETVEPLGDMNSANNQVARLLTICIPTHNRRKALEECLASILPQAEALGVGVTVSDNGSTDGTWESLEALKQQYPWMQTMRHTRDIGYRNNLIGAILSSRAQYVWPIGDKLVLLPGALKYLMSVLVHLHPDAVVVNAPGGIVSTVGKEYCTPQSCLNEAGWWTTLCGATVLPRQAWIDVLHIQSPNRDFPQVVAFFSYLASLSTPQVLFSGRVLIQGGKIAVENHLVSYSLDHALEIWGRNWYDAIISLPVAYSTNDKLQVIRSFSEHNGIFGLMGLMRLRARGQLTLPKLNADQMPLRAAVSVPWRLAVIISVVPRWMLRPILSVHPRRILRAMRRTLRLPRGQQAPPIVH